MISLMAKSKDANEFAKSVLDEIIAKHDPDALREQGKNPAEVARGMRGGAKGGPVWAEKLIPSKRKSIAQKAVEKEKVD
jgi:hypothetical protein